MEAIYDKTVLVTGASGFIATHCLIKLAEAGYKIRGTVRDLSRTKELSRILNSTLEGTLGSEQISVDWFEANLTEDEGWSEAIEGCNYVLHLASPIGLEQDADEKAFVIPAREGTLRVLREASKAGVKRIVLTSSIAAISGGIQKTNVPFNEKDWTDTKSKTNTSYAKSKTLAEQAAWEFIENDVSGMELSCINPSLVLGPVLWPDIGPSVDLVRRALKGEIRQAPKINLPIVDVRDVADLHVFAMTSPQASGKRFICDSGTLSVPDIIDVLRANFPEYGERLPKRQAPDWMIRFLSLFSRDLKQATYYLGKRSKYDSSLARNTLEWEPRPPGEAVLGSANSLIKLGLLESV